MSSWVAAVMGLVEGLTEYLPVSSTAHLILAGDLLGAKGESSKSFEIVIQLGAILAVLVHFRALLWARAKGLLEQQPEAMRLAGALAAGFVPTAIVGLLVRTWVKAHLFSPFPISIAFIIGGVVMISVDVVLRHKGLHGEDGLEKVSIQRGFLVGLGQCISIIPGSSRSMCTIVTGQLVGLSTATAAEFSFLLGLFTLGAATIYEGIKERHALLLGTGGTSLAIGTVVSFFVAWGVIAVFLRYLKSRGLAPFGYYRIILGVLILTVFRDTFAGPA